MNIVLSNINIALLTIGFVFVMGVVFGGFILHNYVHLNSNGLRRALDVSVLAITSVMFSIGCCWLFTHIDLTWNDELKRAANVAKTFTPGPHNYKCYKCGRPSTHSGQYGVLTVYFCDRHGDDPSAVRVSRTGSYSPKMVGGGPEPLLGNLNESRLILALGLAMMAALLSFANGMVTKTGWNWNASATRKAVLVIVTAFGIAAGVTTRVAGAKANASAGSLRPAAMTL